MAYHPVGHGTLLDEVVRRATGSSISEHLRRRRRPAREALVDAVQACL